MNGPLAILYQLLKSAAPDRNSIQEKLLQMDFSSARNSRSIFDPLALK